MTSLVTRLWSRLRTSPPPLPIAPAPPAVASPPPRRGVSPATYAALPDDAVLAVRDRWPQKAQQIVDRAARLLDHQFELLGSGPFVPRDPDRPARDGYQPIDWYLDPVRALRFPRGIHVKDWKLYEMRPGNADVKYPWELARCQHWVTLGQAYRLTGDDRFAVEIARELDDFVEANPVAIGVNWTCTMDVGLRAVSWAIAFDLVRQNAALDDMFWDRAYAALFEHGLFIRGHLENTYEVTSNHFLSNVVGLWFLGAVFADAPQGAEWSAFARDAIEKEMSIQVLPDGADFESAIPYHRLVAELFLGSLRLGDAIGQPLSSGLRARVRDMIAYLTGVLRPDGLMPQAGDADDGRLHVMTGVGLASPQDPRHLLGPAAVMFNTPEWLAAGGEDAAWEAAWWGLPVPQVPPAPLPRIVHLFRDAGHAVARDNGHYLLVTNSIVGTKGFGNHKHNDQLGFEYHACGAPIVADAGSFVYTSDPDARNLFRSTAYHSTLQLDDLEQNKMNREWLFRLFETAQATHGSFAEHDGSVEYVGHHSGFSQPGAPIVHERRFRFDLRTAALTLTDRITGSGEHTLRWHFHLAPGVTATLDGARSCVLHAQETFVRLKWTADARATLGDVFYSPSYGVRRPCLALDLEMRTELPSAEFQFLFEVERHA